MFLTIGTTRAPATDLGYLLHKHPDRAQHLDLAVGRAHVFFPTATDDSCTVALLLEVDPIGLVRGGRFTAKSGNTGFSLSQYVNDRPYAASSMLAVALGQVFRTALSGRCTARPELVDQAFPLDVHIPAVPSRGEPDMVQRLFAPLGWTVRADPVAQDPQIPSWGDSRYVDLRLTGQFRLADALNHLYVLLPVLDDSKHYWVSTDEVDKLVRAGSGWLAAHPERDLIARRYLAHQRDLVFSAVARLAEADDAAPEDLDNAIPDVPGDDEDLPAGPRIPLARLRREAVLVTLRSCGARRVVDMGCGDGALLRDLLADTSFTEVVGVDVSDRALRAAERRLRPDQMGEHQRARIRLFQSSVTYRDERLTGFDALVLMEVIEHLDPSRLPALERTTFGHARPMTVVVTTPNAEYNAHYETLPVGAMRHPDHRFEWTRAEFALWSDDVARSHGYSVTRLPIGDIDPVTGPPTQMAVFTRLVPEPT